MRIVLFACVHNAGRSQMAAAFFNALADPARARAISGGTRPANRVNPVVVEAMREVGIDLSGMPQSLTAERAREAHWLITMGCGDECPVVPGAMREDCIDLSGMPQSLTAERAREAHWLITMGCGDECPVVPGAMREDWPLADPADQPLERVRAIRDEIRTRVAALVVSRGWALPENP
ncbi:MAG: low molecular weight phosphatase family protein [Acidobacteria bacterium]|nr:MAG: low molecular weight phosphatase family protein [Acidobacteriota bacterium]